MSKKYYKTVIELNQAKCLQCGDVITSTHVHDFVWCSCKSLAVDGGHDYLKRCYDNDVKYEDMSISHQEERPPYDFELKLEQEEKAKNGFMD